MKSRKTDIVIVNQQTRDILAIITNTNLKDSEVIAIEGMDIIEVDATKKYIVGDETTGRIKFKNPKSNILYFEDFKKGGHK